MFSFSVHPFEPSTFKRLIRTLSSAKSETIADKKQLTYLSNYLRDQDAATVVVEEEYIDSHFLEDYIQYYSSSFFDNGRVCKRLHFFKPMEPGFPTRSYFSEREFANLVLKGDGDGISEESLRQSYLGFMLIKPLQDSVIGKTCLTTYPSLIPNTQEHASERVFNSIIPYDVNLFGMSLSVEKTLPYQEQDSVVAVCATSALWSYFHSFARNMNMTAPSPAKITRSVATLATLPRSLGNNESGLNHTAIISSLQHFGIEPVSYETTNLCYFQELLFAYMDSLNQPLLLLLDRYEARPTIESKDPRTLHIKRQGSHLVVITGYKKGEGVSSGHSGFRVLHESLEKLYVHDDQIGPFAKLTTMGFARANFTFHEGNIADVKTADSAELNREKKEKPFTLRPRDGNDVVFFKYMVKDEHDVNLMDSSYYVPSAIITGSPSKVKSRYGHIREEIWKVGAILGNLCQEELRSKLSWKIRLTLSNTYKAVIRKEFAGNQTKKYKPDVLVKNLPKYIWQCTVYYMDEEKLLDILIDATDILILNSSFVGVVVYNEVFVTKVAEQRKKIFKDNVAKKKKSHFEMGVELVEEDEKYPGIAEEFLKFLKNQPGYEAVSEMHCEFFGRAMVPLYIKPDELYGDVKKTVIPMDGIITLEPHSHHAARISELKKEGAIYLWLIDVDNYIYIAEEVSIPPGVIAKKVTLGHPCLNDACAAKLAGEIKWDGTIGEKGVWTISNASGRYCSLRKKGISQLEVLISLLRLRGFVTNSDTVVAQLSPFHGQYDINSFEQAEKTINSVGFLQVGAAVDADVRENQASAFAYGMPDEAGKYREICGKLIEYMHDQLREKKFSLRLTLFFATILFSDECLCADGDLVQGDVSGDASASSTLWHDAVKFSNEAALQLMSDKTEDQKISAQLILRLAELIKSIDGKALDLVHSSLLHHVMHVGRQLGG